MLAWSLADCRSLLAVAAIVRDQALVFVEIVLVVVGVIEQYVDLAAEQFHIRARARFAVADYIEVSYNRRRLHSDLGYRIPVQALLDHLTAATVADGTALGRRRAVSVRVISRR